MLLDLHEGQLVNTYIVVARSRASAIFYPGTKLEGTAIDPNHSIVLNVGTFDLRRVVLALLLSGLSLFPLGR
jgi:hypothetical protein